MAGSTVEITSANWEEEVLRSPIPVLVDLWAPWCPPCRQLAPTIEKLAVAYQGRVKVGKLDIDHAQELAGRLGVSSIPTVIVLHGGREVERIVGLSPESRYRSILDGLGQA